VNRPFFFADQDKDYFCKMFAPIPLNLPPFDAKIVNKEGRLYIFDALRKKQLVLTPEEWVRQHWVHRLTREMHYPRSLISLEGGLRLHELNKRSDLVVFDPSGAKILMAEFKAPSVKITQQAFDQIANYNIVHRIPLLLVSNGLEHYYCEVDFETRSFRFLPELPPYQR